ncbi:formimidoylglutamate deiminase [Sphaerisporangium melleum]|uniref:Formimidoylglutamate deiminase n=1 Tax=Sphaerisporangium melleum TaxID=321316 RepID=A0A917QT90_9ACTN|nr:formimidoylglutamate deiminase [Sphaerisporangium melleum]GGK66100.1 formimidoylglutamate deiminase [Sphaerisporangium melleum]GII68642.1 formimidoylglutamate deiminase [Sphaerisporangium melleum]
MAGPGGAVTVFHAEYAWLGGDGAAAGVVIEVAGERIAAVREGVATPPPGAVRLRGVTVPGFANAHSHAFHRALRGRTQRERGTFWTWREQMYRVAARLTPDTYHALARAVYAEMALAGVTCVGEFHYLHHDVGGRPYASPNAMGEALVAAAAEAGVRITLLDTCYLRGGFDSPLEGPQLRFGDRDADAWAGRVSALPADGHAVIGAAVHSVRAVPPDAMRVVAGWADERGAPLHVHLSEQVAENEACRSAHGRTPAELLAGSGVLGPRATAVHATHLTPGDIALLGGSGTGVCMCPTTERDLADGIGPARALADAGSPLSLGSDSNAVLDLLEEARAVELDERLATRHRGHWRAAELLRAATAGGHASLGRPAAGRIEAGAPADFVTVALDTVRTAGWSADALVEAVVFAATAADVREVVVAGRRVVSEGRHLLVRDVPAALTAAITAVT